MFNLEDKQRDWSIKYLTESNFEWHNKNKLMLYA